MGPHGCPGLRGRRGGLLLEELAHLALDLLVDLLRYHLLHLPLLTLIAVQLFGLPSPGANSAGQLLSLLLGMQGRRLLELLGLLWWQLLKLLLLELLVVKLLLLQL